MSSPESIQPYTASDLTRSDSHTSRTVSHFIASHAAQAERPFSVCSLVVATVRLARIYLDNVTNIQASWVTQGPKIGQLALFFGANDMGSVMMEENVVSAAGTTYRLDEAANPAAHRRRRLGAAKTQLILRVGRLTVRGRSVWDRLPSLSSSFAALRKTDARKHTFPLGPLLDLGAVIRSTRRPPGTVAL